MEFPELFDDEEFDKLHNSNKEIKHKGILGYPKLIEVKSDADQIKESLTVLARRYPNILNRIIMIWGTEEGDQYLTELITNTKTDEGNQREGFPPDVFDHLLKIYNIHFRSMGKKVDFTYLLNKK